MVYVRLSDGFSVYVPNYRGNPKNHIVYYGQTTMRLEFSNGQIFEIDLGDDLTPIDDLVFALSFHIVSAFNRDLDVPVKIARTNTIMEEIAEFIENKIKEYRTI